MFKRKFRDWPIVRTLLGKNGAGKKLNRILPFPAFREAIASVLRGITDIAPLPKSKDAAVRAKVESIKQITQKAVFNKVGGAAEDALLMIHDLLDDGQLNDSTELTPETRKKIRLFSSFFVSGLISYEILATLAGWPSVVYYLLVIAELANG